MKFNLSEWALNNKGIILYLMLLLAIVGIFLTQIITK
jgi:multidrug efflux pump